MALGQLHARGPEYIGLEGGLDALGDNLQRVVCNSAASPSTRALGLVECKLGHEQLIDLHEVEVAAREQRQIRAGESRVIERSCAPVPGMLLSASRPSWSGMPRSVT